MIENQSEFFERLDFLVTFLSMKKVTEKPLWQRDQKASRSPPHSGTVVGDNPKRMLR